MNPLFLAAPIQPASVTEGSHPLASGGNVLTNGEGGNLFASVLAQVSSSTTNQGAQGKNQTSSENSDSEQPQLSGQESVGDNQESTPGSEGIVVANAESQQPSPIVTPFIGTPSPLLSTTTESVIPMELGDLARQRLEVGLDAIIASDDGRKIAVAATDRAEGKVQIQPRVRLRHRGFVGHQIRPVLWRESQPFRPLGRLTWIHSSRSPRTSTVSPS